jgi:demethylmenaquinone methyltransferase/2-methoxy-6-polyprenyl-1,4-benzoquinol methylase
MSRRTTHFGYREVPENDKASHVRGVFDSVSDRYDLMNDLMSFGVHRLWKRFVVATAGVRPGQRVLDLASGTGDLAILLAPRVGPRGSVVVCDINASMLGRGRQRLLDRGIAREVAFVQADAEALPYPSMSFDCVTIAFGLRNVTRKERALAEMHRVLRPGGRVLVLEFSPDVAQWLRPAYEAYSFRILPWLGARVAGDEGSYRYLAESIRMHPSADALSEMMRAAGLERCTYRLLSAGIVALHRGYKL